MYGVLLFLHFVGLAMGVGTSFAMFTIGLSVGKMQPADRGPFYAKVSVISKNGSIGLLLLLLSGAGMLLARPGLFSAAGGLFHAKLAVVAVMVALVGYMQVLMRKAKREGGGPAMALLPKLGRIGLLLSLIVVALAVAAFH